jgi:short-subunit dehydrogenase
MKRTLILGATSAIAAEVAKIHAERGDALHLVGRNAAKLARVAAACVGTRVSTAVADFADQGANFAVVERAISALGSLDTVLIAHGDLGDERASQRSFEDAEMVLRVNFTSVVSLLIPLVNHLEAAGAGRLGVITSVVGDRGMPRNYTYGAAKGALNVYLQGVRSRLVPAGVSVTTLKVGTVDTPMRRDQARHALVVKPHTVARDIVTAVEGGAAEIYVPSVWRAIMGVVKNAPEPLFQRATFLSRK